MMILQSTVPLNNATASKAGILRHKLAIIVCSVLLLFGVSATLAALDVQTAQAEEITVFLNPYDGNDSADGLTYATRVKSIGRVRAIQGDVSNHVTVYLNGASITPAAGDQTWENLTILRNNFTGIMLNLTNATNLTLNNVVFDGTSAIANPDKIANIAAGSVTMNAGSSFQNNVRTIQTVAATSVGGVLVSNSARLYINEGATIKNNKTGATCGGLTLTNSAQAFLQGGIIEGNQCTTYAASNGGPGGVLLWTDMSNTKFVMTSGEIRENIAGSNGAGGISLFGYYNVGVCELRGGSIHDNKTYDDGFGAGVDYGIGLLGSGTNFAYRTVLGGDMVIKDNTNMVTGNPQSNLYYKSANYIASWNTTVRIGETLRREPAAEVHFTSMNALTNGSMIVAASGTANAEGVVKKTLNYSDWLGVKVDVGGVPVDPMTYGYPMYNGSLLKTVFVIGGTPPLPCCQIIRNGTFAGAYDNIYEAFLAATEDGDVIELLTDDIPMVNYDPDEQTTRPNDGCIALSGTNGAAVTLTTAPVTQTVADAFAWHGTELAEGADHHTSVITRTADPDSDIVSYMAVQGNRSLTVTNVDFDGAGDTITGNHALFELTGTDDSQKASLTLSTDSSIVNAKAAGAVAGVDMEYADFQLENESSVTNCVSDTKTGGISVGAGATATITDGSVTGNKSTAALNTATLEGVGGILVLDDTNNPGVLNITNKSTISGNQTGTAVATNIGLVGNTKVTVTEALSDTSKTFGFVTDATNHRPGHEFAQGTGSYTVTATDLARFDDEYEVPLNMEVTPGTSVTPADGTDNTLRFVKAQNVFIGSPTAANNSASVAASDLNPGTTPSSPLATFAAAKAQLLQGGTIWVVGPVSVDDEQEWDLSDWGPLVEGTRTDGLMKRWDGTSVTFSGADNNTANKTAYSTGELVKVGKNGEETGELTLTNIVLDGNSDNVANAAGPIIDNTGIVSLGTDSVLQNNGSSTPSTQVGGIQVADGAQVSMANNAAIKNCSGSDVGGVKLAGTATLSMADTSSVSGNTGTTAGGVGLADSATLSMSGTSSVSDNTGTTAGGVLMSSATAKMNVEGGVQVTGNTVGTDPDTKTNNVFLNNDAAKITVQAALTEDASIGVTVTEDNHEAGFEFAQGTDSYTVVDDDAAAFVDDYTTKLSIEKTPGTAVTPADGTDNTIRFSKVKLVDTSFTKIGASQLNNEYRNLKEAKFNVYRYVGETELSAETIASVPLASVASDQWAPIIAANGSEGTPGVATNVAYTYVSSSAVATLGQVNLNQLVVDTWYMLVEIDSPSGYQIPVGQWAFKIVADEENEGKYVIDTTQILAHADADGSLPPAFSTSAFINGETVNGIFVVNTPIYRLPFAGEETDAFPFAPMMIGGIALLLCAASLRIRHLRKRWGKKSRLVSEPKEPSLC